jgi:hypothetical protein
MSARAVVVRRLPALSLLLVPLLALGCGSREPEVSAASGPGAASEGGDVSDDNEGASSGAAQEADDGTADTAGSRCDEAAVTLTGRFSLTRYPGQDALGPNGERPMGMSKEYEFTRTSYTMEGYPPLRITGRYEVLERDGLRRRVRFYDTVFDGRPDAEREVWVVFEDCGAVLQMDGMTYERRPDA